ncbi:reticulophagy regulator 2 [Drosophila nasuta]|uniref:reticulophagy regulator 2 n=1 Tax=Drosophila nasuta TaxID=42062 RepID=UPI00295F4C35|nr:reticulophagy regulator 2 [Drosophila nasuta]XP_060664801.1 reticulophagy regulator 2 [Drosophila nasuta]
MFQIPRPSRLTLQGAAIALGMVLLMSCVRPLGVLFLGLFSYWLYWTRCSFRVVLTPELRAKFESWLQRAEDWRRNSPGMFCVVSSGCLATLAILGHLISGSTLVLTLLVLSALISTKYNFKLLQIERKDFQWSEKINYNNVDAELDDEFMPDVNDANLFVLERASDVATISSPIDADGMGDDIDDDERSDDIPSELLLIPDAIPEIDEHSTDEDDELVPLSRTKSKTQSANNPVNAAAAPHEQYEQRSTTTTAAAATITTTEDGESTMDFRRGHFKRDSSLSTTSSSSEESLSKGLQFPDHTSVDAPALRQLTAPPSAASASSSEATATAAGAIIALAVKSQAQSLLPSLMSNLVGQWSNATTAAAGQPVSGGEVVSMDQQQQQQLVKPQRRQVTALDSSDESDFEILETDDFK